MNKEKIYIFDTTLRDGAQTEGVDFTIEDKNKIAKVLSDIGVDYIEGGWPGANPVDTKFFSTLGHCIHHDQVELYVHLNILMIFELNTTCPFGNLIP